MKTTTKTKARGAGRRACTALAPALLLLLLFTALFSFSDKGFFSESYAEETEEREKNYIKIGLAYGSSGGVSEAVLSTEYGFMLCDISGGAPVPLYELEDGNELKVNTGLFDSDKAVFPVDSEGLLDEGGSISFKGNEYRGGFCFFRNSSGSMNVINYVDLEEYLYSVLASEIGSSAPGEAQKTQAVAARSFTLAEEKKHAKDGFSVCNTTHCQTYVGKSKESATTIEAVDATAGEVLVYDGKVVSGYYSTNSGGYTMNNEDVWGGSAIGYLRAVRDEYAPAYPWSFYLDFSDLEKRLSDSGNSVGILQSAEVSKRGAGGNVLEMTFRGSAGTKVLSISGLRSIFGANILKSAMFTIDNEEIKYLADGSVSESPKLYAYYLGALGDSEKKVLDSGVYTVSAGGEKGRLSLSGNVYAVGSGGKVAVVGGEEAPSSGSSGDVLSGSKRITGGRVYFNGLGWGHSVGMSQQSAIEMAKQGWGYKDILKYFYTGISIEQL